MELKDMTVEQLEERKAAIAVELDAEGADLDALETEVRSIKDELESRAAEEAQKVEIRKAVAAGEVGEVVQKIEEEKREMKTNEEIRASKEYTEAFARYLVSENEFCNINIIYVIIYLFHVMSFLNKLICCFIIFVINCTKFYN